MANPWLNKNSSNLSPGILFHPVLNYKYALICLLHNDALGKSFTGNTEGVVVTKSCSNHLSKLSINTAPATEASLGKAAGRNQTLFISAS